MAIDYDFINTKLQAIQNKDVDAIVAENVHIPFLGSSYTSNQLQNWLDVVSTVLINVRDGAYTETQINTVMTSVYNSLSASDKLIADKIIAGEEYTMNASDADNYDKLRAIIIYKAIVI